MKTLKILLLAAGLLCLNTAFSFTVLNIPYDQLTPVKMINANPFDITSEVLNVVVSDKTDVLNKHIKDTILIELGSDWGLGPFPSASKDCIIKQVPYPEFAREKQLEGGVAVRFRFNDSGNVEVLESCSNSPELEQYVTTKLASLQLKNCVVEMNKDYYLRFMFRLF